MTTIIPWVDYDPNFPDGMCSIHRDAISDCACPPIDEWVEYDLWPYEDMPVDRLNDFFQSATDAYWSIVDQDGYIIDNGLTLQEAETNLPDILNQGGDAYLSEITVGNWEEQ